MPDEAAAPIKPVALITGAGSGIGAALARRIARRMHGGLILVDKDDAGLRAVADSLPAPPGKVSIFPFDVADPDAWEQMRPLASDVYGRLDYACLSAGIAHAAPIPELTFAAWREVMQVNLDGAFLALQAAMGLMRLNPGQGGSIVVLSSAAAAKVEPGIAAYSASKAAVEQLARVAAKEGAPDGIRVNVLAPGGVETPLWRSMPFFAAMIEELGTEEAAFAALAEAGTPLGRFAKADEIAALLDMLLTEPAPLTGAKLLVDGGYTL
jgi:NAD(P)-dependent dehydrogenase (short-subunit alcohol dehydrogenase family)